MALRIGVDIGGSFADFAVLNDKTGELHTLKVFSRPDDPGSEVLAGMKSLEERHGVQPSEVAYFTHGTTVGVNAVVQRKGLRLGLITTRNFEDVLEVARLKVPDMYHLLSKRPDPLIPRDRVFGVIERLDRSGQVETDVDEASVIRALESLDMSKCEGVVISLLHSYRNPENEQKVKEILLRARPDLFVCCSHEVWPIIREYERTITAVIGSYVQPKVSHYLDSLQLALRAAGVPSELKVTKSNGGVMSAEVGKTNCVQMILSGTASGVMGAAYVAKQCGVRHCMSLDIGGTTADVALITDGEPQYATGEYIGDFQIHIPSVSVSSIGDGGGSIAWVDEHGVLKVGPESAGSNPGPACYGRGGTRATITDAFAVMGVLGQHELGYSAVKLDRDAAIRAVTVVAQQLGSDVYRTAEAIVNVCVSGMYAGVSRLVSRFGIDPREFTLMPFGGAGPMLAAFLGRALGMQRILVPLTPGVLSALGGLIAETRNDFVKTTYCDLTREAVEDLAAAQIELTQAANAWIVDQAGTSDGSIVQLSADMRYRGQSFEISTPVPLDAFEAGDIAAIRAAFHREHEKLYGHSDDSAVVQVISLRLVISAPTPKPLLKKLETDDTPPLPQRTIQVYLDGALREVPLYRRIELRASQTFDGPAVVAQDDSTTCVPPGFHACVDAYGNLLLEAA